LPIARLLLVLLLLHPRVGCASFVRITTAPPIRTTFSRQHPASSSPCSINPTQQSRNRPRLPPPPRLQAASAKGDAAASAITADDEAAIQWELFRRYHVGSWKGIWTTYDAIGDVSLETVASVDVDVLQQEETTNNEGGEQIVSVSHAIVQGATQSDCSTCFDSMETKTIPVALYTPTNLLAKRVRLGGCGMVVGPSVLRSGTSTFVLCLSCSW
jgi:hypothetical protein